MAERVVLFVMVWVCFLGFTRVSHGREGCSLCDGLGVFSRGGMPVTVIGFAFVYFLLL